MRQLATLTLLLISVLGFGQSLTNSDKIYGLSKIWSEAKFHFANFDLVEIDWDSAYQATIPKVLETKKDDEYYEELIKFMVLLKDGHSNVYFPSTYYMDKGSIPMRTKLIEQKVIVIEILNDSLRTIHNIDVGDEIIEINGMNAIEYGQKYVKPFQSASTQQDLDIRTYRYSYLFGKLAEPVKLKIRKQNDRIIETSVFRIHLDKSKKPSITFTKLGMEVGLLTIDNFVDDNYKDLFDSIYPKILLTKGLIIDVRKNGGGNNDQCSYILSHFIDKTVLGSKSKTRQTISAFIAWGFPESWYEISPEKISPIEGKNKYLKPLVVLTSAQTFSAAEDFVVMFNNSKRGITIGSTTGGSTGMPYFFNLPGGGSARICTKRDCFPNGKEFVGIGIKPDIEIQETVLSIQKHKDIALDGAIEYLEGKLK